MANNKKFWMAVLMQVEVVRVITVKQKPMKAKIMKMIMTLGA